MKNMLLKSLLLATFLLGEASLMAMDDAAQQQKIAKQEAADKAAKKDIDTAAPKKEEIKAPEKQPAPAPAEPEQKVAPKTEEDVKIKEISDLVTTAATKRLSLTADEVKKVQDLMKELTPEAQKKALDQIKAQQPEAGAVLDKVSKVGVQVMGLGKGVKGAGEELNKLAPGAKDSLLKRLKDSPIGQKIMAHKGAVAIGAALLAILGIGGAAGGSTGGILGTDKKDGDQVSGPGAGDTELPDAIVVNPYEEAQPDNESFQKNITLIAMLFSKIKENFETSLDRGDYYSPKFRINLGQVTLDKTIDVAIEYNFGEGGAGSVGSALTPIEINIIPNEIDGFAVTVEKLLAQVQPEFQELATALLKPTAAMIFTIKIILLTKTVFKDPTFKDHFERIRETLTQSALLYSRLVLVPGNANLSTQAIISGLPLPVQEYLGKTTTKMHPELVKAAQSAPLDSSALLEAVLSIRSEVSEYKERVNAMRDTVLPLIQEGLSYLDQKFVVHALVRQASDLGDKLPKATDAQKQELIARLDVIMPLLDDALQAMTDAAFDAKDIATVEKALDTLTEIKASKKTLAQNTAKPRLGDPKSGVQDIALVTALDIFSRYFKELQGKKFKGDYGYKPCDLLLGKSETIDDILADLLRAVNDVVENEKTLLKSTEPAVELRKAGQAFTINPADEYEKMVKAPSDAITKAHADLVAAVAILRADPKNDANKTAYEAAKTAFDTATKSMSDALQKYRNSYPPYYPTKFSDGSTRTEEEFLKDALKTSKTRGRSDALKTVPDIYGQFQSALGLPLNQVWETAD